MTAAIGVAREGMGQLRGWEVGDGIATIHAERDEGSPRGDGEDRKVLKTF